jgi:DNA mismatch repair protein MutL
VTEKSKKRIQILSDEVINHIAAGEIVERPSSVVKELVENSLDADSTRIDINIMDGGKKYICVTDNGIGLTKDQALLAFERNATSKISNIDDLNDINTMGFRGEALPSITSVGKVVMKTKSLDFIHGTRIEFDYGKLVSVNEIGCPDGTSIEVFNLFKKVPARLHTLKDESTEFKHIQRCISERLLAFNNVHFILRHNEKLQIDSPAFVNLIDKLNHFLGDKVILNGSYIKFFDEKSDIKIKGFIASPFQMRKSKANQYLFVNKRPVQSKLLNSAIYNAFQPYLQESNAHPVFLIYIECPPFFVDVNVHPAKIEVRFKNSNQIYKILHETIANHLNTANFKPSFRADNFKYDYHTPKDTFNKSKPFKYFDKSRFDNKPTVFDSSKPIESFRREDRQYNFHGEIKLLPLSQFQNTYIIAKGKGKIVLIDQHTAHERILYEKALFELTNKQIPTQMFLFPIQIELTSDDSELIMSNPDLIKASGFEIEHSNDNNWLLKGIPIIVKDENSEKAFINLLDDIRSSGKDLDREKLLDKIAKTLACHGAVRSGEELNFEKMQDILELLEKTKTPSICPHGRPTKVELDLIEIEKIFKRR